MRGTRRRRDEAPKTSRYVDDIDDDDVDDLLEDDEEDDEEEAEPRRGRRRDASRPRGRSRDESRRPSARGRNRRAFDEGAEEGRKATRRGSRRAVEDGWDAVDKLKAESGFAENLKVPDDDEIVIKFLDEKPYAGYREHWVQEAKSKRKTYSCLGPEECPLCVTLGHQPNSRILFNVVDMSGSDPTVKTWAMGTKLAEKIKALSQKPRTSPINREDRYWIISKTGKGTSTEYNLEPISSDDLVDWDLDPLDEDEIEELMTQRSTKESIRFDSVEDLEELVEEIL